jgi:hypothetical protein
VSSLTSDSLSPLQPFAIGHGRASGRAARDERGDSVWEWQVATGVFERDVTDEQLRRLEAPGLQIVESFPAAQESGRWIHDSLQSGSHKATRSATPTRRPVVESRGALRQLWARLRGNE